MTAEDAGVSVDQVERKAALLALLMLAGTLPLGSLPASLGVVIGALLALLNFRWLTRLVRTLVSSGRRRIPRLLALLYLFKYLLSGVVIFLSIKYDAVNVVALLAGVSVIFLAICWEGLRTQRRPKEGANHAAEF